MEQMVRPIVRMTDGRTVDLAKDRDAMKLTIVRSLDNSYDPSIIHGAKDNRKLILAIDDMVVNLKAMEGILKCKYRIAIAKTSDQALKYLYRKKPDLILMDIDMPDVNGIDLAQRIKEQFDRNIPIIFVTALAGRDVVLRSREVEAQDYILKPFRPLYLLDRVGKALGEEDVIV